MRSSVPSIMEGPCWRIAPVGDLPSFFRALPLLVPPDALLCLAAGAWDRGMCHFLDGHRVPPPSGLRRPRTFRGGVDLPATSEVLAELAGLSERRAEPEVAGDIAVSHLGGQVLEWFDVPDDPFAVSRSVPVDRIATFCRQVRVTFAMP